MTFADLAGQATQIKPPTTVQIQLNWSEYFQGQWSPRKSSDIKRFAPIIVDDDFNPTSDVYIHASIDAGTASDPASPDPIEAALIHLDGIDGAFRLSSKNSEPVFGTSYWRGAWSPYNNSPGFYYDASKVRGLRRHASRGRREPAGGQLQPERELAGGMGDGQQRKFHAAHSGQREDPAGRQLFHAVALRRHDRAHRNKKASTLQESALPQLLLSGGGSDHAVLLSGPERSRQLQGTRLFRPANDGSGSCGHLEQLGPQSTRGGLSQRRHVLERRSGQRASSQPRAGQPARSGWLFTPSSPAWT